MPSNQSNQILPEPVAWLHSHSEHCIEGEVSGERLSITAKMYGWVETPLYTEQQVLDLLTNEWWTGARDVARLDWLDAQVKCHPVYNGYTWQEAGYEDNRGLVCTIQKPKQKLTARQAIDAAIAAAKKE